MLRRVAPQLLLAATVAVSCGGRVTTDPFVMSNARTPVFVNGSRLRAQVFDGGGDAIAFRGFMDTALNAPCSFLRASDNELRCLPGWAMYGRWGTFVDAACTDPVYLAPCGPAPPAYSLYATAASPCWTDPDSVAHEVVVSDSILTPQPGEVFAVIDGACTSQGPPPSGTVAYSVHIVDPATFVPATEVLEPRTD